MLVNRPGLFEQFDNDLRYSRWSLFFNAIDIAQFKNSHMEKARINNTFHFDARLTSDPAAVAAALVARWAAHQPTPYFPEALRALPSPTQAATASATPQPQTAPESAGDTLPDPERRLIALRELGGEARWKRGRGDVQAWQFTGIEKLVQQEKAQGRKRHDEKTIRQDLREAAQAESMAKRNGWPK